MGIKHLNKYLLQNCTSQSIHSISINNLRDKTIVVDTSIYIYKFLEEEKLKENFQNLIKIFEKYNINPIFVFDGKPPIEKKELLKQRQNKKREAELKYNTIINDNTTNLLDRDIINRLSNLKKKFIRICNEDIQYIKSLLKDNNLEFVDAPGEADELCVQYVKSNKAWACLSDDMDMFIFGCNRVLRNLSLLDNNVTLYLLPNILNDLKMTMELFRDILVISGTDYNLSTPGDNVCLRETLKWYKWYKNYCINFISNKNQIDKPVDFYKWLLDNSRYIKDYNKLLKIHKIFQNSCTFEVEIN